MISRHDYDALAQNRKGCVIIQPDGQIQHNLTVNGNTLYVIAGSFDPLHNGHKAMYWTVQDSPTVRDVYFEVSIARMNKKDYSFEELNTILKQFEWYAPVIVTNSPRYAEKIELFRKGLKLCFALGYDSAKILMDNESIEGIEAMENVEFIVFPRGDLKTKKVMELTGFNKYPSNFIEGRLGFAPERYLYLSSTEIRNAAKPFVGEM